MVVLRGYVRDKSESSRDEGAQSDSESDSDDDDFDNHDLDELTAIARGNVQSFTSPGTKKLQIDLQILEDGGRKHTNKIRRVSGRFDPRFVQPFWMVTVEVRDNGGSLCFAKSAPYYRLREDDAVDRSVYSLFLKSCYVEDQHNELFLNFVHANDLGYSLKDLLENLAAFGDSSPENEDISAQIQAHLRGSVQGKAFLCLNLTQYVHQLFPRKASKILEEQPLEVLQKLNKALEDEPWVLGYRAILRERFGLLGCEAKLKSLKECKLLEQMSQEMRDALQIYATVSHLCYDDGHTFFPLDRLKSKRDCDGIQYWDQPLQFLAQNGVMELEQTNRYGLILFLPHLKKYENDIAESISKLMGEKPWISAIDLNEQAFGGDADQIKAAWLIANCPVVVMSGKGGCGKTHVISEVLKGMVMDQPDSDETFDEEYHTPPEMDPSDEPTTSSELSETVGPILLTAPTGKAARILSRRTSIEAFTLHFVIYSFFHYLREKQAGVQSGETQSPKPWKFSSVQMLVCDECSLVSVKTFAMLVEILVKNAKLKQLVLLGDINQLPSIEPGNFLGDVYQALEPHGLSVTLTTNHRSESALIIQNADLISHQKLPKFDPQRGFEAIACGSDADELGIVEAVQKVLKEKKLLPEQSQFIAFRKKDCLEINELCARHYNGHSLKDHKKRDDFQVGDKVCIGRNRTCFDCYRSNDVRLCNGEIFFIKEDVTEEDNKSKIRFLKLDNGEEELKINFRELKKAKIKHAWAKTIHTYQGSEIEAVIYVVGKHGYQNWQHVYTAVTRGRSRVYIVCDQNELQKAVTNLPITRYTRLKEFLEEKGAAPGRQLRESICMDLGIEPSPAARVNEWRVPADVLESPNKQTTVPVITARYNSLCPACEQPIQMGIDRIYRGEQSQRWIHLSCEDQGIPRRMEVAPNDNLATGVTSSPKERHVASLVGFHDDPDDDELLGKALDQFESSVDEIELSQATLWDDAGQAPFFISKKNLRRDRTAEKDPPKSFPPVQSPGRSPARATSENFPPKTSTPVKEVMRSEGEAGNESGQFSIHGNRLSCSSSFQTPPGTPAKPGSQVGAISPQSLSAPPTSPWKRKGESEFESPGKRSRGVTASYETMCVACEKMISKGNQITKQRGPYGRWVHYSCGDNTR